MRKLMMNIMSTTGITLLVLSAIAVCYHARFLCIESVFQAFFANVLIHIGVMFIVRHEFLYPIAESLLSMSYVIIVALVCGRVFHWYDSMSIGVLILMSVIVYLVGCFLSVMQLKRETDDVNLLLQERKGR